MRLIRALRQEALDRPPIWFMRQAGRYLPEYRELRSRFSFDEAMRTPAVAAEISASAFRITQERPLHGRVLTDADARPGAPPVAVVGYELWRDRLGADPNIIGRSVRIGGGFATVVGVMPEGFGFPIAHELWLPFRTDAADAAPRSGPPITVFGKLVPGVALKTAQAELTSMGRRVAAESPTTHAQLEPRVRPYGSPGNPGADELLMTNVIYSFIVVLLVVAVLGVILDRTAED